MRKTLLFSGAGVLASFVSAYLSSVLAALLLPPDSITQAVLVLPHFITGAASTTGWIAGQLDLASRTRALFGSAIINLSAAVSGAFLIYSGTTTPTEMLVLFAMFIASSLGLLKAFCLTERS